MLVTSKHTLSYPQQPVILRPQKPLSFKGASEAEVSYPDYKQQIPDAIYKFFSELPKYELHSHFNGATPLNISKLFLNKENQFIGISSEELEDKYVDIRKRSTSLADWLQKTYELKAKNITTMDITTAAYAIAMEEAKQNCRYLEVRIDPYSKSFVGSPEDVIRAAEVGLRNAREDVESQGKELKTGIILLAERHAPSENSLQTARLATSMRSQRILFEKMYKELKQSHADQNVFDNSSVLKTSYLELMCMRKVKHLAEMTADSVYNSQTPDREKIKMVAQRIQYLLNSDLSPQKDIKVPVEKIEKLYNTIATRKTKTVSTMDLVPVVYAQVLDQVKNQGKKKITITINPFNKLYKGEPEDILRAVQVGLRNASIDLEKTHGPIDASIMLELDQKTMTPEQAARLAKLTIKMKSQHVLFEKMYAEMKDALKKEKIYDKSLEMDQIVSDLSLINTIKEKVIKKLSTDELTKSELIAELKNIFNNEFTQFSTKTAQLKTKRVLASLARNAKEVNKGEDARMDLVAKFSEEYSHVESYIQEKAFISKKVFDNLKHHSTLKLTDKEEGTKNADRFLRMGSGVIPSVTGIVIKDGEKSPLTTDYKPVFDTISLYNARKKACDEKVTVFPFIVNQATRLEDVISDPNNPVSTILEDVEKEAVSGETSFDESTIHTVYSKSQISKDLKGLIKMVSNQNNPDAYVKLQAAKSLKEVSDKLKTQYSMHENKFLLSKRIFDNLRHYSELKIQDLKNGSNVATRYARMGVDIIPNVVGFDVAGNENEYPIDLHKMALHHIKYYNERKEDPSEQLFVTVHAGEVQKSAEKPGWKNIEDSINLGAHRIGHGIDLRNAPESLKREVKLRNILMETCPKVNFQTKAVEGYRNHPILDFLDEGIPANINTDNPVTAGTNLTNEFVKLFKRFNYNLTAKEKAAGVQERFTLGHIKQIVHSAIWGAFGLTPQEKAAEEAYAMNKIDTLVKEYGDKVVLKDDEPIMIKVQKGVVAFTGSLKRAIASQLNQKKAA